MKVSLNWLKEYVDIQMGVKDLAHLLTMAGLEVGEVISRGEGLERVVVAQIDSIGKHPNADRLSLVEVRTDRDKFSIVCGASNIREGQRVPLALIGAKLPNGLEIKRSKIRGVASEGMLCSEIELGFGRDAAGIMILPAESPLGNELADALGLKDTILDLSVTPNRPDWLCVIGVAREIAALTHQKVRYPRLSLSDRGDEIHGKTSVTLIDPDLCPRYLARMIEGVKISPSPQWMRELLEKVGVRAINNVVDVTNYVMMEYGQPLHAFDFEVLEEGRIVVRRAQEGEAFVTLDGVKRIMISECGHAYEAFRWTAANIMDVPAGIEVTHIVRLMYDFWKAGRITLKAGAFDDVPLTFHDSCKIQRRGGHLKEPRELLKVLAPKSFREMDPCREQAMCCGGGGGVISIQEADPLRFAVFGMKIDQMKDIGAQAVCMVCSNCRLQFTEGVAHFNSDVKVRGLSEMVAKALA